MLSWTVNCSASLEVNDGLGAHRFGNLGGHRNVVRIADLVAEVLRANTKEDWLAHVGRGQPLELAAQGNGERVLLGVLDEG